MKRIILLVMSVLALCGAAKADNHRVISVDKLPAEAQKFLKTHFADDKILLVTEESVLMWKEYDVIYEGGKCRSKPTENGRKSSANRAP